MQRVRTTIRLLVLTTVSLALFVVFFLAHTQRPIPVPSPVEVLEGREDDPLARQQYEWSRLHDPATGQIPVNIREQELAFAKRLPERQSGVNKTGRAAGTQSTVWAKRGPRNVGGRTRALAIDRTNSNVILAGGASGGMWRSLDGGSSWTEVTAPGQLHSVTCIVQDPRAGHTSTWYYGTGEYLGNSASGRNSASYTGDGIFKSVDNGASWTLLSSTSTGLPESYDNLFDYVWDLSVDPSTTVYDILYAAVPGAILRSTDGGTSWATALNALTSGFSPMTDVQVTTTGVIYAAVSSGTTSWGVWRSIDDGVSWTDITPSDMLSTVQRIVFGIAPSNENVLYFLAETPGAGYQTTYAGRNEASSFWKYTYISGDGSGLGGLWENRSANLPDLGQPVGNFASQASYDLVVKVKPDDENVVFIGGTNLYRSSDGFASAILSTGWIGGYATVNNVSQYASHHPDQHSLAFAPNSTTTLFSGHDGGVSKTTNDLSSSLVWSSLNNGYLTTQFYTVAIDHATSGNPVIIGGLQDNGTWFTNSTLATAPWVNLFSGDGAYSAIADGRTSYYVSSQNGTIYRMLLGGGGGLTDYARVDPAGGSGYKFLAPFTLDPANTNVMYLAAGTSFWRNSNLTGIPTWTISPGTAGNTTSVNWANLSAANVGSTITAFGVSKALPSNRVYYGTNDGQVFRLDNASTATEASPPTDVWSGKGFPAGAYVSCIAVDPSNGDNALLVFSNYSVLSLFYTTNAGASWTNIGGNLEENPTTGAGSGPSVRWASILPFGGNIFFYVGTSIGLFSTTVLNGISTVWTQEGSSTIGNVVVDFVDTRAADGLVVIGTHGQGVFSGIASPTAVAGDQKPVTTALLQNYPNPFNPSTTIRFTLSESARIALKVYDINGREVATLVDGERAPGAYRAEWAPKGLASGTYVYRLQAGNFVETKKLLYLR